MSALQLPTWSRLIRFIPHSLKPNTPPRILIGSPLSPTLDVGLATFDQATVEVEVYSGTSVLDAGEKTGEVVNLRRLLSIVSEKECGSIRCIGLNYVKHAAEASMPLPSVPILFLKPSTSLTGPYPSRIVIPKFTHASHSADYESELVVIIAKDCKNVAEDMVLKGGYVLGYTAGNDVSARKEQFATTQWSFSKGFDTACPIGPVLVSPRAITDVSKLHMRGIKNGKVMQESGLDDLIFSIPKIISFLSQGTTLPAGTIILTGTPHGIGIYYDPPEILLDGDDFRVEISGGIGTLINTVEYEK